MSLSIKIILCCAMTLILALGVAFYVIADLQDRLIMGQIENEARAIFRQIVITRQWIADHGGIFVEKKGDMQPNPYLDESEIIDIQGRKYLRSSPAMVTKEISKYARGKELYWFHITSLKLKNPENSPDNFERKALLEFEQNRSKEFIRVESVDSVLYLRYMSPLYVEQSCLRCHKEQGYKVGDVRGAISIMIPIEKTLSDIKENRESMMIAGLLTVLVLMAALFVIIQRMVLVPMKQLKGSIADFSEGRLINPQILKTGDEFEDLFKTFTGMASKIRGYQKELEEKVKEATNELEEANMKLRDINQQLNDINTRKSDFIASASHELRTPLTTIKGAMDYIVSSLDMAKNSQSLEKSITELMTFCELIKKNCERLIRMVSNMLDLERIEQGAMEGDFTLLDLTRLINDTINYLKPEIERKSIALRVDAASEIMVYADEDRIRQVLINIISNAIKYSPEASEITISAVIEEQEVVVSISDNGEGISDPEKERVFEKFYKGKSNKEGSGLGLTICKSIIDMHKGVIGCKDPQDGSKGTCVYFTLPLNRVIMRSNHSLKGNNH